MKQNLIKDLFFRINKHVIVIKMSRGGVKMKFVL